MLADDEGKPLIIYEKSNESDRDGSNIDVKNPYEEQQKGQEKFNSLLFAIPSFFYLVSCVLQLIALSKLYASTFMLLRSSLMIFTAVLSTLITKKKIYLHHWIAIGIVTIGLVIVGIITDIFREKGSSDKDAPSSGLSQLMYMGIMLVSQFFMSCQYISEELYLKGY